ncbi:MAG: IS5 family transposase [Acidobacteria bacterium]|nr:IS5 family transposase [Acidobacteriota bacterium]
MRPPTTPEQAPADPSRVRLALLVSHEHPLYQLAEAIDWSRFEADLGALYAEDTGRPGLPTRLMVGLHYLKYLFDESDESVVEKYVENPYWQFFCGRTYFEHELPCHPTSLVRWRRRLGAAGVEKLLTETLSTAKREQALRDSEIKRVNVDTTVQEKAVAFPTDARLYHKARRALVRAARAAGLDLRQTYVRLGKQALARQGRYAHARQMKRARRETKRLRQYLGRVIRDIRRKCPKPAPALKSLLERSERILHQQRYDSPKLYSVHAPEVECIAKGKAHRPYEFGCKVAVVTTSKSSWVVGISAVHENPYDGATLAPALKQVERTTEVRPEEVFVDRGFKGAAHHPAGVAVYVSGRKRLTRTLKALLRRRSAIEPVIGHLKGEHGMQRNHLLGQEGDRINALLTGCGFNLRKLWWFFKTAASLQPA